MAISSPLGRRQTVAALLTLTFVTGLVDAVSYLRLGHVFVANMTGNVVFLGFSVDPHSGLSGGPRSPGSRPPRSPAAGPPTDWPPGARGAGWPPRSRRKR